MSPAGPGTDRSTTCATGSGAPCPANNPAIASRASSTGISISSGAPLAATISRTPPTLGHDGERGYTSGRPLPADQAPPPPGKPPPPPPPPGPRRSRVLPTPSLALRPAPRQGLGALCPEQSERARVAVQEGGALHR